MDIDSIWNENFEKLQGSSGIDVLVNDNDDVLSRIVRAVKDVQGLPADLNNPESIEEAEAVNTYATMLHHLFCEGAEIAEAMMLGVQVEKAYNDIQDETGNTRDLMHEAGHSDGDF